LPQIIRIAAGRATGDFVREAAWLNDHRLDRQHADERARRKRSLLELRDRTLCQTRRFAGLPGATDQLGVDVSFLLTVLFYSARRQVDLTAEEIEKLDRQIWAWRRSSASQPSPQAQGKQSGDQKSFGR
jgi:hypothetical protein